MIKILKNEGGNIALAMLLAVVGMMSGLSIASMSLRDTIASQAELESIQGLHLLRAETFRGQSFLETAAKVDPGLGGGLRTPLREVPITGSNFAKTYTMQSQITRTKVESEGLGISLESGQDISVSTGAGENQYLVRSLIETKTGVGQVAYFSNNKSIVRKYSELTVIQNTGPIFMYFSDNEASPNGTNVYFYGYDVINGPLHSNTDIRMKKLGGGDNQGWPTFMAQVTTCGEVISEPAQYPRDQVFRGGLIENFSNYEFPTSMQNVRLNGTLVGPASYDPKRIVMVDVDNRGYGGFIGDVGIPRRVFADVWPDYPYHPYSADTPPSYRNNFMVSDTTWSVLGGGSCGGRSNFVNSKLWLKGTFGGFQTWGAADTLYLIGDILLNGTPSPQNPYPQNRSDMVGIISEKSILIKYGYRDPQDSLRIHTNMGSDSNQGGIWIYAALAALGDGNGNSHYDGVFTFEYQHPHGSVTSQLLTVPDGEPIVLKWIDLHRNHWPPTSGNPWPAWLDLPWYNPLWPERQPYLERGTINIWGGVNQRRRGFVHRNYYDSEWPSNGAWNPPKDYCGATSAPNSFPVQLWWDPNYILNLQTRDWPGAAGSGTGYKKNYNYDVRMYKKKPPDWPEFKKQGQKTPMEQGNWLLKRPPRSLI
ncbi:MAG: hypothetical protein RBS43_03335 [Candidatus Cloacimonas sp.]|jgi:hypothetical protein|nr:hypothetical protein [Candidatus Cloacimonas sp.]